MKTLFLAVLCALIVGCTTPPAIQFGMYQVPAKNLSEARALGMDFVVGPAQREYLDEAERLSLKVITADSKFRHRAVMGSILTDEPDLHGISPEQISADYKTAKRGKPVFLNLSSGYSVEAYAANSDVVMFDWYPVNWTPVETYYAHLRAARLAAGKKPFYAVIQTFDWSKYPKQMPPGDYRKPTPAEVKAMTVWAAMNGAKGIVYYPFDDGHSSLAESPGIAKAIKESVALVRNYDWLFETPRQWISYPFEFLNPADKTNAIAETSIAIRTAAIGDVFFIVAANTTERAIRVKCKYDFDEAKGEIQFDPFEVKFLSVSDRKEYYLQK